jgi:hypothetical protein
LFLVVINKSAVRLGELEKFNGGSHSKASKIIACQTARN